MTSQPKQFENWPSAFDYCRECDRPVTVIVAGEARRLFPSGHARRVNKQQANIDTLKEEVKQANVDRLARELYDPYRLCSACQGVVTLAEQLAGQCPHCQAIILAGPITLERAREMLSTLKARREKLGLNGISLTSGEASRVSGVNVHPDNTITGHSPGLRHIHSRKEIHP